MDAMERGQRSPRLPEVRVLASSHLSLVSNNANNLFVNRDPPAVHHHWMKAAAYFGLFQGRLGVQS